MALPVHCDECGYHFKVPDEYGGRRGRCPKCKTMLAVPPLQGTKRTAAPAELAPRAAGRSGVSSSGPPPRTARRLSEPPPRSVSAAVRVADETDSGLPQIAVDDAASGPRHGTAASRAASPRRRSEVPRWLWAALASAAVLLGGVAVWVLTAESGADGARPEAPAAQRRLRPMDDRPALPAEAEERTLARLVEKADDAADSPPTDELPSLGDLRDAVVASTLDEVKRAVVKVVVSVSGGTKRESGSGFFVDGRGWIVTNDHVIKNINSAARVRLADGMICQIEGVLARAPDRDLALLKLRERPYRITILDIHRPEGAKLGEQVYAFGHPYDADFSLSRGIVSRVLRTSELAEGARHMLRSTIRTPDNVVWIQHDAKISPGNSGGPLIDEAGRVLGVNSFVHLKAEFGYASDVRYLREMVTNAEDEPTPLPAASNVAQRQGAAELLQRAVEPEQLHALFAQAERFHFQPDSPQQYALLANLAAALTVAKHLEHDRGDVPEEAAAAAGGAADELVARLEAVDFRPEQYEAVNRFARNVEEEPGQGVFAFGTVVGQGDNALILQIGEGGKNLLVQVGPELAKADPLSRWLVLGVYSDQVVQVQPGEGGRAQPMRVLIMYYMLRT